MADGKTINLYNSSQYIERIDTKFDELKTPHM